ncbi:AzlC family ABC transporter permease [Aureimonas sp. AU4]|uniref:AzlC family ABC transporter permease n=1 Tax=Aureimonas sp. AU4 TaxID=1638163 RepID=UPI00078055D0|nr:AzlC family ABC transporter permease [Aureimonas sp. AU4]
MNRSDATLAARHCLPLLVALVPFGFVYGAIAVDGGLSLGQTLGFSLATYAGASQFLAVQMIGLGSPLWAILLAVLAVNARHLLYSASIGRHLGAFSPLERALAFFLLVDPAFAAGEARAAEGRLSRSYYFCFAILLYVGWAGATLIGALAGSLIEDPHRWGLDFALPVYFLAQTMAFRKRAQFALTLFVGAATALLAYVTLGSPWHITLAGVAGMLAAAIRRPDGEGAA